MTRRGKRQKKEDNTIIPFTGSACKSIDRAPHETKCRYSQYNDFPRPVSYRVEHLETSNSYSTEHFKLLDKAKSELSKLFPGKKVITFFHDINIEILHLVPIFDSLEPDLISIRTLEENSVLLGRIDWYCLSRRVIFIKGATEEGIYFRLDDTTPLSKLGVDKYIAIKNPKFTLLPDGRIGFRTDEEVLIMSRNSLESVFSFLVVCVSILAVLLFIYVKYVS